MNANHVEDVESHLQQALCVELAGVPELAGGTVMRACAGSFRVASTIRIVYSEWSSSSTQTGGTLVGNSFSSVIERALWLRPTLSGKQLERSAVSIGLGKSSTTGRPSRIGTSISSWAAFKSGRSFSRCKILASAAGMDDVGA